MCMFSLLLLVSAARKTRSACGLSCVLAAQLNTEQRAFVGGDLDQPLVEQLVELSHTIVAYESMCQATRAVPGSISFSPLKRILLPSTRQEVITWVKLRPASLLQ